MPPESCMSACSHTHRHVYQYTYIYMYRYMYIYMYVSYSMAHIKDEPRLIATACGKQAIFKDF